MGPLVFGLKKALFGRIDLPKIEVIGAPGMYIYIYILCAFNWVKLTQLLTIDF